MNSSKPVKPYINGLFVDTTSSEMLETINPSTGKVIFKFPKGTETCAHKAVESARKSFNSGSWGDAPPSQKKQVLLRFADLVDGQATTLDSMDAEEMGKPLSVGFANTKTAAIFIRFCAEAVDKITGVIFNSDQGSSISQRRVPRGVVAAIAPWNFPTFNAIIKVVPALVGGNSVVLKPSELSSRSGLLLAELAIEAGLPPGVFNVVPGAGETVGRALALHMDVDMIAFTGSTMVGKLMLQYAGQSNMKVVQAECGGKSPQIVFADGVDLDAAADSIVGSILTNQGQVCVAGSRLLVQKEIERELVDKIIARFKNIQPGNALNLKTTFGPISTEKQYHKILQNIKEAQEAGAKLAYGGHKLLTGSGGFFIEPTILCNVQPQDDIAQREIFGPVLSVITFEDADDAIEIANGTIYGLAAYVWTSSLSTGMKMIEGVRSSITVNSAAPTGEGAGFAFSYEPFGQSGVGVEGGLAGIESYMQRQLVSIHYDK